MTRIGPATVPSGVAALRRVHFRDSAAPTAATVTPSVFVAARDDRGHLLMVRRGDSGAWEFPGGRVDVGESAVDAAVRETVEESGVLVRITGVVGLFTDPAHVVVSATGEVRQQFVLCLNAWALRGEPVPDLHETIDAAWFGPADVAELPMELGARRWVERALSGAIEPCLD